MGTGVLRLFGQDVLIDFQRLLLFVIAQQHVCIESFVVQVVRILVGQCLHLGNGSLFVAHLGVDIALGIRQPLALAFTCLHALQGLNGLVCVVRLLVKAEQHLQQLFTTLVLLIELFHHADGFLVVLLADIHLSHRFKERRIVRLQLHCFQIVAVGQAVVSQYLVVLCQIVIGFCSLWIQLDAVSQKVEGRIVIPFLPLDHGFKEKSIVARADRIFGQ